MCCRMRATTKWIPSRSSSARELREGREPRYVDVDDAFRVEHEPPRRLRRTVHRFPHTSLHVARVREEEAVVEPVDDDTGRDPRGAV